MENNCDYYARKRRPQPPSPPHRSANEQHFSQPPARNKSRSRDDPNQHRYPHQERRENYAPQKLPSQRHIQPKGHEKTHGTQAYSTNNRNYPDSASYHGPQLKSALKSTHSRNEPPHHMRNGHDAEYSSSDELQRRDETSPPASKHENNSNNWAAYWNAHTVKRKPSQQILKSPAKASKTSHPVHPFAATDDSIDDERHNAYERPPQGRSRHGSISRGRSPGQEHFRTPQKMRKIVVVDDDDNEQVLEIPIEQLKHARTTTDSGAFAGERRRSASTHPNVPQGLQMDSGMYEDHQQRAKSRHRSSYPAVTPQRSQSKARDPAGKGPDHDVKYHHRSGQFRETDGESYTSINGRSSHPDNHRRPFSVEAKQLDTKGTPRQSTPTSKRDNRAISISDEEAYPEAAGLRPRVHDSRLRIVEANRSQTEAQALDYDGDVAMSDHEHSHHSAQRSPRGASKRKSAEKHQQEYTSHSNQMNEGTHIKPPDSLLEYNLLSNPINGFKARKGEQESHQARSESPLFVTGNDEDENPAFQQGSAGLDQQEEPSHLQKYLALMAAKMKGNKGAPRKATAKSKNTVHSSQKERGRHLEIQRTVLHSAADQSNGAGSYESNTDHDGYPEDWQDMLPTSNNMEVGTTWKDVRKEASTGARTADSVVVGDLMNGSRTETFIRVQDDEHEQHLERDRYEPNGPRQMPASTLTTPMTSPVMPGQGRLDVNGHRPDTSEHREQALLSQNNGKNMAQDLTRFVKQNDKEAEQRAKALADARERQELLDRRFLSEQANGIADGEQMVKPSKDIEGASGMPPKAYDRTGIQSLHAGKRLTSASDPVTSDLKHENVRLETAKANMPTATAVNSKEAPKRSKHGDKNSPLDPRRITEADRILWRMRNNSTAKWDDTFIAWKRATDGTSNITSTNGLSGRYKKLKATVAKYGTLQPTASQISDYLVEVGAQDAQSIIDSLPDSDRSFQSDVVEMPRPTTGGKTVSIDIMRAYLASIDEQVFESADEDDQVVLGDTVEPPREPSPPREEDKCHWVYYVKRKVLRPSQDEAEVDWVTVGTTFTNVKRANVASMLEINKERGDVDVWPLKSWHWEGDDEKGMSRHVGKSDRGTVLVSVDRYLQTFKEGRLPETREGFLKKEVYVVFVRTSTYAITESYGQGQQQLQQPAEGVGMSTEDIESSGWVPGYDEEETLNIDQQNLEALNLDDLFGDLGDLQTDLHLEHDQTLPTQEPPTWASDPVNVMTLTNPDQLAINGATQSTYDIPANIAEHSHSDEQYQQPGLPEINEAQYQQDNDVSEPRQPVVSNRTLRSMIQEPLEGIYSVLDAANRAAGRHLLELRKLQVPAARRNKMDEILAAQKAEKAMNEMLDELEQGFERFKDGMELDEQVDGERQVRLVEVWVEERRLEVPRNI